MKKLAKVLLACLPGIFALVVHAQSPFSVLPRAEFNNGGVVVQVAFDFPTNHVLYADKLHLELSGQESPATFNLAEPRLVQDKFSGKQKRVFTQPFKASCELAAVPSANLMLKVHLQGCDEANCFFPEDKMFTITPGGSITEVDLPRGVAVGSSPRVGGGFTPRGEPAEASFSAAPREWRALAEGFTVADRGSGYMNEKEFLGFLNKAQSGQVVAETQQTRSGFLGVLLTMSLILLGGVALNLTPCILPMIPINLAIIGAGAQAGSKRRGFALGATYAAGMAIAYGVLGLFVVLTGSKFGTLNSSPWFNLGIAIVFVLLALAMFDVVSIDLSRFQSGSTRNSAASRSKFVVAYTMGTVAALLAGACVAPVVISVLLQATALHAKGLTIGLLLPFLLGVGMGLPWPFAGAGLSFLPKPGKWMMRVKYGFGVMIVLFAAYYGHLAFGLFQSESMILARAAGKSADETEVFSERLTQALRESRTDGRPVFIDFWASWCKNCSAMEHTTFASAAVKRRLADFHEVRLQTERPNQAPAKEVLDHFKVMGLPSFVVLTPKNSNSSPVAKSAVTAVVSRRADD
ncbi:MAG: thioredoxin family protein [Verrucomicrobia bacterium]|nr:thioredoxin family protein [Verrucomicrobiota bacterium]